MKHLLSVFIMGSEVRQFVHSGLFGALLQAGWKITVMSKVIDQDLHAQLPDEVALVPFLPLQHSLMAETTTKILDKAFHLQCARRGESMWKYGSSTPKSWRETLLNHFIGISARFTSFSKILMNLGARFESWAYKRYNRKNWEEFFQSNKITTILVNVPKQPYWNPMLVTAQEMGLKTILLYHTTKDMAANPRLNQSYSLIGVWNERMKRELLRLNPSLDPNAVYVVGCGHFDCVGRRDWLPDEQEFRSQIGAAPDSLLVVYPTSGPGIVPRQERYVEVVVHAAKAVERALNKKIQIIFRMNPMDNRKELCEHLKITYPEHIVLRPDWVDIRKSNWTYAKKADPIFYNALLHYASLCITIPSTVNIDAALAGTPIINLGVEVPGEQPLAGSIKSFWDADYNRNVKMTNAARFVVTKGELEAAMIDYLTNKELDSEKRSELIRLEVDGIRGGESSKLSLELINSN